jgi:undecaprenyl-diphosphatase
MDKKQLSFKFTRKIMLAVFAAALILSFYFDQPILNFIESMRFNALNDFMLFITKDGLIFLIAFMATWLLIKKNYSALTLLIITVACSLESAYLLKKIFQIPRPFTTPEFEQMALKLTTGYSFPSMHAAFCMGVIPFLHRVFKSKYIQYFFALILLLIAFSRVYIGLHYMSDVIAGGLLGYGFAIFWSHLDESRNIAERLLNEMKRNLELRRQAAHALTGIALIFLVQIDLLTPIILAVLFLTGSAFVILLKYYHVPLVSRVLHFFEREKDLKIFPGKGPFFFVLGSLLSLLFFERQIALASIAIMAIGDAVATIAGHYFGKYKNPLNQLKHLEGTVLAIIASTVAAFTFVPFHLAFIGSVAGIVFESLTIRFIGSVIDDNLLIPIVAGIVMTALA